MEKTKNSLNQAFITAFLVIGVVAVSSVAFRYSGSIQLKFGADGIQLQITGEESKNQLK